MMELKLECAPHHNLPAQAVEVLCDSLQEVRSLILQWRIENRRRPYKIYIDGKLVLDSKQLS
jgi:hypothetical protein